MWNLDSSIKGKTELREVRKQEAEEEISTQEA